MKKDLTEVVFILDRSGSMSGLESDAVGGFNSVIKKQTEEDGEALVSTVLFNHEFKMIHDRVDIKNVPVMSVEDYQVSGSTALIDAIGRSVHHISNIHKYIREEDRPEHTIFVVMTDGMENASHQYSSDEVKKMIEEKKENGWEFIFMAANIDAVETAACFGIEEDHAVNFHADEDGIECFCNAVCEATTMVREGRTIGTGWKTTAERDYRGRTKK